jgi:hypothetical protein
MLEHPILWLGPRNALSDETSRSCLVISEAQSRRPLGMARWRPRLGPFWRRWFTATFLEIVESEDESLLCTVHRAWWLRPSWEVFDADARYVGSIQGTCVLDPYGHPLAMLVSAAVGSMKRFVDSSSRELGRLQSEADGNCLFFGTALPDNPFARMLLLATVLVSIFKP